MDGLRWLLLFFGLVVVAGVYLYSRREQEAKQKTEPVDRHTPTRDNGTSDTSGNASAGINPQTDDPHTGDAGLAP